MEIQGKILEISDTMQVTDSFKKREFVVEYADNPQYPEFLKFECIQDKCAMLDSLTIGQDVKVSLNLKGRKWTDPQGNVKYFNSLQAWRVEPLDNSQAPQATKADVPASNNQIFSAEEDSDDDLPF